VGISLAAFIVVYGLLGLAGLVLVVRHVQKGPAAAEK